MRNEDLGTDALEKKFSRWDKLVKGLRMALGVYAFLVLTYLAVQGIVAQTQLAAVLTKVDETTDQVRQSQLENQKTGTENHEKTRAYIRCLFTEVLTVPLAQRTDVDFDTCTRQVDSSTTKDTKTTIQPSSVLPSPSTSDPKPSEPNATAPPDPEQPVDNRTPLQKLPLIGGLFKALGI